LKSTAGLPGVSALAERTEHGASIAKPRKANQRLVENVMSIAKT
jgi:hypothetical protein